MVNKGIETRLVKKTAKTTKVCTNCDNQIFVGAIFHREEGVDQHLHSLIARQYCSGCYAKYGGIKLLKQK